MQLFIYSYIYILIYMYIHMPPCLMTSHRHHWHCPLARLIKHTKDPALVKLVRDMIQEHCNVSVGWNLCLLLWNRGKYVWYNSISTLQNIEITMASQQPRGWWLGFRKPHQKGRLFPVWGTCWFCHPSVDHFPRVYAMMLINRLILPMMPLWERVCDNPMINVSVYWKRDIRRKFVELWLKSSRWVT